MTKSYNLLLKEIFVRKRTESSLKQQTNSLREKVSLLLNSNIGQIREVFELKQKLKDVEENLSRHKNSSWWKNTAKVLFSSLQHVGKLMFPAYPKDDYVPSIDCFDMEE